MALLFNLRSEAMAIQKFGSLEIQDSDSCSYGQNA